MHLACTCCEILSSPGRVQALFISSYFPTSRDGDLEIVSRNFDTLFDIWKSFLLISSSVLFYLEIKRQKKSANNLLASTTYSTKLITAIRDNIYYEILKKERDIQIS